MKKLTLSLITLILISACSSSDDEVLSVAREGSPPNQVVEYVWHYKDTNFSEENLNMLIDKWNSHSIFFFCLIKTYRMRLI